MSSLYWTALWMGLVGGPHCVAMCGVACWSLSGRSSSASPAPSSPGTAVVTLHRDARAATTPPATGWAVQRALIWFLLGRLLSYAALGAVAASAMDLVGWLSTQSVPMRHAWTGMHLIALWVGLSLILRARQPDAITEWGRRLWRAAQGLATRWGLAAPLALGLGWALWPCGLLYSAVMIATLSANAAQGAGVMVLFALGSGVSLWVSTQLWSTVAAWGWWHSGERRAAFTAWATRIAGAMLVATAVWGLWMGWVHNQAPWCVTPT